MSMQKEFHFNCRLNFGSISDSTGGNGMAFVLHSMLSSDNLVGDYGICFGYGDGGVY
jgi:hypothetical protein